MNYIKSFDEISLKDLPLVGGKNASLGEMVTQLSGLGVTVPYGFAVTSDAYWHYMKENQLLEKMKQSMTRLSNIEDMKLLQEVGAEIRNYILAGTVPEDLKNEIMSSYYQLSMRYGEQTCDVAVRSSATAEDLPGASFAGQQETYLHISNIDDLIESYKKCLASLFTDRAIAYRIEYKFDHFQVALSVGVQKMIRADLACSGVAFSLDTETGFKDVVTIETSYGLGEAIVKGIVTPDNYQIHKPLLAKGFKPIIKKQLGQKLVKMVYGTEKSKTHIVPVDCSEQNKFVLSNERILELARIIMTIEDHYSSLKNEWSPMDVEWAIDGIDNKLYIIQARPETVYSLASRKNSGNIYKQYRFNSFVTAKNIIVTGLSIGKSIVSGRACIVSSAEQIEKVQKGDILVTTMTDPDWVPIMKKAAGIITDQGGRTCHAAIVSRELEIPAIVGTQDGTRFINDGEMVTLDCSSGSIGFVYEGELPYIIDEILLHTVPQISVQIMMNIANPEGAFSAAKLPVSGVGLARIEFIIANNIRIHPKALLFLEKIDDPHVVKLITQMTQAYTSPADFFVEKLSEGIATIAAAFFPRPVTVRFSDFKSNEYRELIGGRYFESIEANPMIGLRGASRYYHDLYRDAFALECAALKKVRNEMGFSNVKVMVPFIRTLGEAHSVLKVMSKNGLDRSDNGLEIIMMCEVPSNVLLIDQFCQLFDGFSIGSNDLTQLTLGVDRDSYQLADLFDERDPAVKEMMSIAIEGAKRNRRPIGVCGQAPSDFPDIAEFLIHKGITSLSLNQDSILPFLMRHNK